MAVIQQAQRGEKSNYCACFSRAMIKNIKLTSEVYAKSFIFVYLYLLNLFVSG